MDTHLTLLSFSFGSILFPVLLQKSKMFEAGYPFSNPLDFVTETSDRVSNVNSLADVKVSLL